MVLLLASGVIFFLVRRRKRKLPEAETSSRYGIEIKDNEIEISEANDDGTYLYSNATTEVEEAALPVHISLQKDENLKENAKVISAQDENLEEEFYNLVDYVQENIKNEMTIASQEGNKEHNRYIDIGTDFRTTYIAFCFSSLR